MEENNPKLTITNTETGETVLSIPLVKYLLLTEAEGHDMTNQEYLDRQDEYNMTFFLDESMKWINTRIIINDWVVRFNDLNMLCATHNKKQRIMKKWYSYIILALVCIGFASCQDSDTVPQLQTDGRVSVHLQIALPGGDSAQRGATARSFENGGTDDTTSDQKALSDDDVFVLVFQNGVLIDQVKGLRFDAVTGGTNPSSRTLTGTFVQPETDGSLGSVSARALKVRTK